ncbi:MAG: TadE/TadG family type IV pilus assembly protein [Dehalococcoidia bacterium]
MSSIKRAAGFVRSQRGQTIIEFAFIMPIVCLFLFVIVDFGIALDHRIVLQHAAREGARYGAVNNDISFDSGSVQYRTAQQAQGMVNTSDVVVCYTDPKTNQVKPNADVGDSVDVCIKTSTGGPYTYDPIIIRPIFSGLFGGTVGAIPMPVTGSARLEQKPTGSSDPRCPCPVPTPNP